jgi:hypothetical protein
VVEKFSVIGYAKKKLLAANIKNNQQDNFSSMEHFKTTCLASNLPITVILVTYLAKKTQ